MQESERARPPVLSLADARPPGPPVPPYTVRAFLDDELPAFRRVRELEAMAGRFTGLPLDGTVEGIRTVIGDRISMEDYRRLHILISHLYHACGADIPLTTELRTEVNLALARRGNTPTRETETR
ncbi:hypothetical protein OG552_10130 [Streptomyces sp. NBC_01476]|uniref:hypothetical protein n=1 Tax=Streptomyces sp. NBC_01476 TaxID=2903881 RepID=UPI002E2FE3E5|nr:hypothetical protein [Streptomyces sp. NBC_01476]